MNKINELAEALRAYGFTDACEELRNVTDVAWTSSAELLGELGLTLVRMRKQYGPFPPPVQKAFQECMREVAAAWPDFN
jgi:hypothetical protein